MSANNDNNKSKSFGDKWEAFKNWFNHTRFGQWINRVSKWFREQWRSIFNKADKSKGVPENSDRAVDSKRFAHPGQKKSKQKPIKQEALIEALSNIAGQNDYSREVTILRLVQETDIFSGFTSIEQISHREDGLRAFVTFLCERIKTKGKNYRYSLDEFIDTVNQRSEMEQQSFVGRLDHLHQSNAFLLLTQMPALMDVFKNYFLQSCYHQHREQLKHTRKNAWLVGYYLQCIESV